jgi:hypothetical protein
MFVSRGNYSPRLKVAADPPILGGWSANWKLPSTAAVTTEAARVATHPTPNLQVTGFFSG